MNDIGDRASDSDDSQNVRSQSNQEPCLRVKGGSGSKNESGVAQSEKRFRWPRFRSLDRRRCRPLPAPSPCAQYLRCCVLVTWLPCRCCVGVTIGQGYTFGSDRVGHDGW